MEFLMNMRSALRALIAATIIIAIGGCSSVRQKDLDAWVGMPVEALETHSLFVTVPLYKTATSSGIEIWNYANGADAASCFGSSYAAGTNSFVGANVFLACSSNRVVCNNLFYIKDRVVVEYKPTGRCYTDESVQPETRYNYLRNK